LDAGWVVSNYTFSRSNLKIKKSNINNKKIKFEKQIKLANGIKLCKTTD
jgi:hypothetical protein